jgi:hypothetical protein
LIDHAQEGQSLCTSSVEQNALVKRLTVATLSTRMVEMCWQVMMSWAALFTPAPLQGTDAFFLSVLKRTVMQ